MKTLLIHPQGTLSGSGGAIATYRLHKALQARGIQSTLACRKKGVDDPSVVLLPPEAKTERLIQKVTWRLGLNEIHCTSAFKLPRFEPFRTADVVNYQGMHGNYFSYLALPRITRSKPGVLTLHDMWHLTGHCALPMECERWKTGCGRCPALNAYPPVSRDATAIEFKLKKWAYNRSNLTIVAPSRRLAEDARRSSLGRFDIRQIPNAVDTSVFRPMDKAEARKTLGLPPDRHVIMFAAMVMDSYSKGGHLLCEALQKLDEQVRRNTTLLLLGDHSESLARSADLPAIPLGYVTNRQQKIAAYAAADVFVLPSRWENQSLVIIEAMACGTPCVAFDVGGLGELIEDNHAGLLAPPEDTTAFASTITTLLTDDLFNAKCGEHGRDAAVRKYDIDLHAKRFISLYEEVIEKAKEVSG